MKVEEQIKEYIGSQPEPKRSEMQALHDIIREVMPSCKLWFLDGKNSENKIVSNPNIGYGLQTIEYADGKNEGVLSNWFECKHNRNLCLYPWY
jgi:hypothetical protein